MYLIRYLASQRGILKPDQYSLFQPISRKKSHIYHLTNTQHGWQILKIKREKKKTVSHNLRLSMSTRVYSLNFLYFTAFHCARSSILLLHTLFNGMLLNFVWLFLFVWYIMHAFTFFRATEFKYVEFLT